VHFLAEIDQETNKPMAVGMVNPATIQRQSITAPWGIIKVCYERDRFLFCRL